MFGIGGQGSFTNKNEDTKYNKNNWTPEQTGVAKTLGGQIQTGMDSGWAQGQTQATPYENQALEALSRYLSGNQDAQAAYQRAMTGQGYTNYVDPKANEERYAAIEKQTLEDILPKTTQAIAKNANLSGMLRSGPAVQMQLDNRNAVVNNLSNTLASLKQQDEEAKRNMMATREGRQLEGAAASDQAAGNQLQAGFSYGQLPRTLQGNQYDNALNQLALYFLGLKGTESGSGKTNSSSTSFGGSFKTL